MGVSPKDMAMVLLPAVLSSSLSNQQHFGQPQ